MHVYVRFISRKRSLSVHLLLWLKLQLYLKAFPGFVIFNENVSPKIDITEIKEKKQNLQHF